MKLSAQALAAFSIALFSLVASGARAGNESTVLEQAQKLGAPMQAVQRAITASRSSEFTKKDVIAVFDISQSSSKKRFYVLDFAKGKASSYLAAHGRGNGDNSRAYKFSGFGSDFTMTPLGPLKTSPQVERWHEYQTVVGKYDGKVYPNLVILRFEGTTNYNSYINRQPGVAWILHSKWYVAADYRRTFPGMLGRSLGCIVLDPIYSNQVFTRLQGGALVYVTVGNQPVEKYL